MTIPVIMTKEGPIVADPSSLRARLLALVAETNPGYTANLPGSLIEDISSTDVGALVICDSFRVELINSISPYGANEFLLNQLGRIYGVERGASTRTSVNVVFSGPPGFIVAQGFIVSDGTNQYTTQASAIIGSVGETPLVFCLATTDGTWVVPENTVVNLVTSIPTSITDVTPVTVNNPQAGTPSEGEESLEDYRKGVLQAGLAVTQGMATMLRTDLRRVAGVQSRLVSVRQQTGGYSIIVGGGDPYEVANAIFMGLFDISTLQGSSIDPARDITVTIQDFPDTYNVVYINPPQQIVGISVTWNTTMPNFTGDPAVAQKGGPALEAYVNSLYAGQPMNLFELQNTFQDAVSDVITPQLLTRMVFSVTIDGVVTPPSVGTGIIAGDPEGYFFTQITNIAIARG